MPRHNVRDQLLEAGVPLLYARGYNACGVQDITNAAGVPKGSFYNHFDSKEALAVEALNRFWEIGEKRRALLTDPAFNPVERLRRHFRALSRAVVDHDVKQGCMIGNFSAELPTQSDMVRERLSEAYRRWASAIETCVEEAVQARLVRAGLSSADVANFLLNSWEGAVLRAKVEQDQTALNQFERVAFTTLFI